MGGLRNCRDQKGCDECQKFQTDQYWWGHLQEIGQSVLYMVTMLKQVFTASSSTLPPMK